MLDAALAFVLALQDPAPANKPAPQEASAPVAPAVEAWNDKIAKTKLDEFTKLQKGTPTLVEKNRALDVLAPGANKLLVKPLAQIIETEKLLVIRKRAAELLANQPVAEANPAIRKLLKNSRVGSYPPVMAELLRGLGKCGYDASQWNEISDVFEKEYHLERVPMQEAILDLVQKHKEKKAVDLLLRNLDEPLATNVDAAENPPAEYWEARWKSWHAWRGKVKETLFVLTGQRFSDATEAKAWLQKNPLK